MDIETVLSVKNLVKIFQEKKYFWQFYKPTNYKTVINNISFDLKRGEILGLVGDNGSGKTTIMQMLLSTLTPSSGLIEYFGKDLSHFKSEILENVSFVNNYVKLPEKLTIAENLEIFLNIYNTLNPTYNSGKAENIENYLNIFNLYKYKDQKTEVLSSGQILKLMLIKAFIIEPEIILLDEPTSQIDPESAQQVREFILQKQKERNLSIILTSHNIEEIDYMCSRVLVLKNGKIYNQNLK